MNTYPIYCLSKKRHTSRMYRKLAAMYCIGLCCLLFSCSTKSSVAQLKSHETNSTDTIVKYATGFGNYNISSDMAIPYRYTVERNFGINYGGLESQFTGGRLCTLASEIVDGEAERADMARLQRKMANHPEKKDKYVDLINKKYNELMQNREERISYKLKFLNGLYSNITKNDFENFGKQCKKHCSNELAYILKYVCKENRTTIPFWSLFCNGDEQEQTEIKTNHIKYNDYDKPELKNVYRLMYNRNCALKEYDAIPFSDADARWYQVTLGKQPIFLRLEGTGKFVLITGLINPQLNLAVKDY